jgi:hypothetical protein
VTGAEVEADGWVTVHETSLAHAAELEYFTKHAFRLVRENFVCDAQRRAVNVPFDYVLRPPQRRDPVVGAAIDLMASISWTIDAGTLAREEERVSSPEHKAAEARFDALNKKL